MLTGTNKSAYAQGGGGGGRGGENVWCLMVINRQIL